MQNINVKRRTCKKKYHLELWFIFCKYVYVNEWCKIYVILWLRRQGAQYLGNTTVKPCTEQYTEPQNTNRWHWHDWSGTGPNTSAAFTRRCGKPKGNWRDELDTYLKFRPATALSRDEWRKKREAFALKWGSNGLK